MTFQSPLWLLALLAVAALVALYVLLQLRRKAVRRAVHQRRAARLARAQAAGLAAAPRLRRCVALGLAALVVSLAVPSTRGAGAARAGDGDHGRRRVAVDAGHRHRARPLRGDAEGGQGVRRRPAGADQPRAWSRSPAPRPRWCRPPPTGPRCANAIDNLELAESTAIGEAIFTSLTAIENFQSTIDAATEDAPPARIVLLSDGYNTVGRDDTQAIDAARAAGVPVSTIAFGTDYGTLDLDGETVPVPVDRATLEDDRRRDRRQLQRGGQRRGAGAGLRRPGQPDRLHDRAEGRQLLVRARRRPAGPDRRRA